MEHIQYGLEELGKILIVGVIAVSIIEFVAYILCKKVFRTRFTVPYMLLAPAIVGVIAFIVYPFLFNVSLAFSNMSMRRFLNYNVGWQHGVQNFIDVFTVPILQRVSFFTLFIRTLIWTVINVFFHVVGGMFLAILLNRPMRLQNVYRTILILPWAIPQVIVALTWRCEFHYQFGFMNIFLQRLGFSPIPWLEDPFWAMVAVIIVNVWLGIPFMMTIIFGGLQSIPQDYYDVAQIDGAGGIQQFFHITIPLLKPVLIPAVMLGIIWTFNNFNVIFLINQGGPMEGTHILITSMYHAIFGLYRYGFGAMYSMVLFVMLMLITMMYFKAMGGFKKEVYE